jgi:predicted nucleotide-binding protein
MARLDKKLLNKLASKLNKKPNYIRVQVSRKAARKGISSEAELIIWARNEKIGTATYLRKQASHIQEQARKTLPQPANIIIRGKHRPTSGKRKAVEPNRGVTVFVVHGRNAKLRNSMFNFLRAVGLKPLEWTQIIKMSKKGTPYIGTLLETAFSKAAAVVVLITPDDEARLKKIFVKKRDPNYEKQLTGQARPNVLFEAGMAFGRDSNSTVLVQVGNVRPFSDVTGRHIVVMNNTAERRNELAVKLSNAGCAVDTSGSDWYSVGDFTI